MLGSDLQEPRGTLIQLPGWGRGHLLGLLLVQVVEDVVQHQVVAVLVLSLQERRWSEAAICWSRSRSIPVGAGVGAGV